MDSNPEKLFRQLFGYAISAKRYALYTRSGNEICVAKASGHGLGYLFAPKETKKDKRADEDETPEWVMEAWEFLLRKELGLASKEPSWLNFACHDANGSNNSKHFGESKARMVGPV